YSDGWKSAPTVRHRDGAPKGWCYRPNARGYRRGEGAGSGPRQHLVEHHLHRQVPPAGHVLRCLEGHRHEGGHDLAAGEAAHGDHHRRREDGVGVHIAAKHPFRLAAPQHLLEAHGEARAAADLLTDVLAAPEVLVVEDPGDEGMLV